MWWATTRIPPLDTLCLLWDVSDGQHLTPWAKEQAVRTDRKIFSAPLTSNVVRKWTAKIINMPTPFSSSSALLGFAGHWAVKELDSKGHYGEVTANSSTHTQLLHLHVNKQQNSKQQKNSSCPFLFLLLLIDDIFSLTWKKKKTWLLWLWYCLFHWETI